MEQNLRFKIEDVQSNGMRKGDSAVPATVVNQVNDIVVSVRGVSTTLSTKLANVDLNQQFGTVGGSINLLKSDVARVQTDLANTIANNKRELVEAIEGGSRFGTLFYFALFQIVFAVAIIAYLRNRDRSKKLF